MQPIKPETPNARFWHRLPRNGALVKITLRPGQMLGHQDKRTTEEGWSAVSSRFFYDVRQQAVVWEFTSDGVDCDGRLTQYTDWLCPVDDLHGVMMDAGEPNAPNWRQLETWQDDFTAQAAGY